MLPSVSERPGERYQCTDNRNPLTAKLLRDYHVLTICGQSLKQYTKRELELIRQFVEAGGGLLLAADVAEFELEANQPVAKMAQNAVAKLFGAQFLSADCEGARAHGSLQVYVPFEQVKPHRHVALGNHCEELVTCHGGRGPIEAPAGASILASCKHTGEPLAAAFKFGQGRVAMVGTTGFAAGRPFVCTALAHWLGAHVRGRPGTSEVPAFIGSSGTIKRGEYFHLACDANCADRLPEAEKLLGRIDEACKEMFGKGWKPERLLHLRDSIGSMDTRWDSAGMGAQVSDASLARQMTKVLLVSGLYARRASHCLLDSLSANTWETELTVQVLEEIGYQDEAERCRERADRWIAEMDRRAATFDLARSYGGTHEQCARGLVVARELFAQFGHETVRKMLEVMPEKDQCKHLPANYAWDSDRGIYYLSLATGKDLFPWFAERGLTVHPLPIIKPTARSVKKRMMARLNEALRDGDEELASGMDAAMDLVAMGKKQDWLPTGRSRGDEWTRLCRALKLSKEGDKRAPAELKKLAAADKPDALRAIAGVALADMGDKSVARSLVALARKFEPRFQLAAGYALQKAGSARAEELSLERVTDARGRRVGKLSIIANGYLEMYAHVEGYKVANVLSSSEPHPFTRHATVSSHAVWWVHTAPPWRRCGLSRRLMEKTMSHPAVARCSMASLSTGTRNVAHRLYRDCGFTDVGPSRRAKRKLPAAAHAQPPTGIVFRECRDDDAADVRALILDTSGDAINFWKLLGSHLAAHAIAYVAEEDGKLVGVASAEYGGNEEVGGGADITLLTVAKAAAKAVKDEDKAKQEQRRQAIADTLLSLLHHAACEAGAKEMVWRREGDRAALERAGYVSEPTGGVWMLHVRHLPQFLAEMAPAIETRLAKSDFRAWEGTVDLLGGKLQGRLTIRNGKVKAGKPTAKPADIVMSCDEETATRISLGLETPFEAYMQARMSIEPRISDRVTKLLETLFPKLPVL